MIMNVLISNLSSMCNTVFTVGISLPILKYYEVEPVEDYSWNNITSLILTSASALTIVEMIKYRYFYYEVTNKKKITYLNKEFNDIQKQVSNISTQFNRIKKRRSSRTKEIRERISNIIPGNEVVDVDEIVSSENNGDIKLEIIGHGISSELQENPVHNNTMIRELT